jgi:DNA-binding transcriptional regulator LsrR (DeoR family)
MYVKLEAVGLAEHHCYMLPVTQVDIAGALDLSNVHVNRVLRQLREEIWSCFGMAGSIS